MVKNTPQNSPLKLLPPEDRYLNLAGAPWSPQQQDRYFTPTMNHCFYGGAFFISLVAVFSSSTTPQLAANLGSGLGGGVVVAALVVQTRRNEAKRLTPLHKTMVIDKQPLPGQKTAPEILERVNRQLSYYKQTQGPANVCGGLGVISYLMHTIPEMPFPYAREVSCFMGAAGVLYNATETERRLQFDRIAKGEWVITDTSMAIRHFEAERFPFQNKAQNPLPSDQPNPT